MYDFFILLVKDFWFWAFLTALFMFLVSFVLTSKILGSKAIFGFFTGGLFFVFRTILVLPFVKQPRLYLPFYLAEILGIVIFLVGLYLYFYNVQFIKPLTRPNNSDTLVTEGLYRFMRHPMMIGEFLLWVGTAIFFRSLYGIPFSIVVGGICIFFLSVVEEERMVEEYGASYNEYQQRVNRFLII